MSTLSHEDQIMPSIAMQLEAQLHQAIPTEPYGHGSSQQPEPIPRIPRVARACDECRSRKIKCDGRYPCVHCSLVDNDCTYDRPNKRGKRLSQKEIEDLQLRLQRAQNILQAISPDLDVNSANLEAESKKSKIHATDGQVPVKKNSEVPSTITKDSQYSSMQQDELLETVFELTGELDFDEEGNCSYHGHGSSSAFLRRIGEQFGNVSDIGMERKQLLKLRPIPAIDELIGGSADRSFEPRQGSTLLPPEDVALVLVSSAFEEACALFKFVHEPSFYSMVHRLYDFNPEQYGHEENKFLPLLYAALSVGYLFCSSERAHFGYAHAISQSEKYFVAARQMLSITECRDIWSLQALLFMIIFLQSSAKMSTCHSYISAAIAASLQMGLHRSEPHVSNPIERETRKKVFWTVRVMESYVIAILGLPRTVSDDDIDQEMPLEIDDEYITKDGVLQMPDGQISKITGFNAYLRLAAILGKVVTKVYPTKSRSRDAAETPRAYVVSDEQVREVEKDLQHWAMTLPMQLRPGGDTSQQFVRIQYLLRLAFTHVQLVLYRPFLHYISCSKTATSASGQCYAYAAACVNVGRNVIHNAKEMEKQNTIAGPYWFSIYTTFCASLSLIFYVWENADVEGTLQTLKDAEYGRDLLVKLGYKSMAAARHSEALATIFERLPERLGKSRQSNTKPQKKCHPLSLSRDETYIHPRSKRVEISGISPAQLQQGNSSTNSGASVQESEAVNLGENWASGDQLNLLHFSSNPDKSANGNFTRFLGPHSLEDIFRSDSEYSGDIISSILDSTTMPLSQNFDSLDQYVSMLDVQEGQEYYLAFGDN